MISYNTNWMGPISTKWYETRDIPFVTMKKTSKTLGREYEYKEYLEKYSCGRIDIYGLDEQEYWGGKSEYSVAPMRAEDWNKLQDWLDELQTETLLTYKELISRFEKDYRKHIRWAAF